MKSRTAFFYDDIFLKHDMGPKHPESAVRLLAINELLHKSGLFTRLSVPDKITPSESRLSYMEKIHTRAHIQAVLMCPGTGDAAITAVSAVCDAVDAVCGKKITNAFCAVRPPGHHAHNDSNSDGFCKGEGFCFFNNVAIAARYAQCKWGMQKILIVDWDYHHGNGTQDVFYDDPTVLYFSTHRLGAYPLSGYPSQMGSDKGVGYTINYPLPSPDNPWGRVTDYDFIKAFEFLIRAITEIKFKPDLIMISSGFDSSSKDPIGDFGITERGFFEATKIISGLSQSLCKGRLVSILEGGYNPLGLAQAVHAHITGLCGDDNL